MILRSRLSGGVLLLAATFLWMSFPLAEAVARRAGHGRAGFPLVFCFVPKQTFPAARSSGAAPDRAGGENPTAGCAAGYACCAGVMPGEGPASRIGVAFLRRLVARRSMADHAIPARRWRRANRTRAPPVARLTLSPPKAGSRLRRFSLRRDAIFPTTHAFA
jgi:hypothetical protein